MMNGPSSPSSDPYSISPSLMPYAGLEHAQNNWEAQVNYTQNHTHPIPIFDPHQPPFALPLASSSHSFPFYPPLQLQHAAAPAGYVVKMEDAGGGRPIGLNLGHRTYFSPGDAMAIDRLLSARAHHHHQPPRCQAEGCKADLSGAKHYHRRHKVCEFHSKATVAIAGGLHQRFCQQCSRFHVLAEFDEAKRSCRKRLADHNRRRRKPQNNNNNYSSDDKTKLIGAPMPSRDSTSSKTTSAETANSCGGLEGSYQGDQSKAVMFRNGPALSLGGLGGNNQRGVYSNNYQLHHFSPSASATNNSSSSSTSFYHQSLQFGSGSSEAYQSTGGGSDQHQASPTHLSQAMFEVDFM